MFDDIVSIVLATVGIYLVIGVLFSLIFMAFKGLQKVDEETHGAGILFSILIFPGLTVFWVYFLTKWIKT